MTSPRTHAATLALALVALTLACVGCGTASADTASDRDDGKVSSGELVILKDVGAEYGHDWSYFTPALANQAADAVCDTHSAAGLISGAQTLASGSMTETEALHLVGAVGGAACYESITRAMSH